MICLIWFSLFNLTYWIIIEESNSDSVKFNRFRGVLLSNNFNFRSS